jgi:hypothetical protein
VVAGEEDNRPRFVIKYSPFSMTDVLSDPYEIVTKAGCAEFTAGIGYVL